MCKLADFLQGLDDFRLVEGRRIVPQENNFIQYPTMPKVFKKFENLRNLRHNGQVFSVTQRSQLYMDRVDVIIEMIDTFQVFSRRINFNPEMENEYAVHRLDYTLNYNEIIHNIDIVLQEDQVVCV